MALYGPQALTIRAGGNSQSRDTTSQRAQAWRNVTSASGTSRLRLERLGQTLPRVLTQIAVPVGGLRRIHQRVSLLRADDEPAVDRPVLRAAVLVGELPVGRVPAAVVHRLYSHPLVLRPRHALLLALPVRHRVVLGRGRPADQQLLPVGTCEPGARRVRGRVLPSLRQHDREPLTAFV